MITIVYDDFLTKWIIMETQNLSESLKNIGPHIYQEAKTCSSCGSFFVDLDESKCESCGRYLNFSTLIDESGDILGKKSFFTIREEYWKRIGTIASNYEFLENMNGAEFKDYKKSVLHRYNILLEFFYTSSTEDENFSIFFIEFREIIKEMLRCNIEESLIWKNLEEQSSESFFREISEVINEIKKDLSSERPSLREKINRGLNYKILGTFSVGVFVTFGLSFFTLIAVSLGLYEYFLL